MLLFTSRVLINPDLSKLLYKNILFSFVSYLSNKFCSCKILIVLFTSDTFSFMYFKYLLVSSSEEISSTRIPLLIIPFIFLFNKNDKQKAIKNYILGFLTLALTIFFFVYTKNDIDNLSSILLEPSAEYNVQLYGSVDTTRYALQGFLNMAYFIAAIIFFYMPTIGKKEKKNK